MKKNILAATLAAISVFGISSPVKAQKREPLNQKAFENFIKADSDYLLLSKSTVKSCTLESIGRSKSGERKSTSECKLLYTVVKPSGFHEFIVVLPEDVVTFMAPPGGKIKTDGTHWKINGNTLAATDSRYKLIKWATAGECVSEENKKLTCQTEDGKVGIRLNMEIKETKTIK